MSLRAINASAASAVAATLANEFIAMAACIALARGDVILATRMADEARHATAASVLRSTVGAGALSDPTFAAELGGYSQLFGAFAASLRFSAFDQMMPSMRSAPLHTRTLIVSTGATGTTVTEGQSRPVSRLSLAADTLGPQRAVATLVVSDQVLRTGGAQGMSLFGNELRRAVSAATDAVMVATLTDSISATTQTGTTAAAMLTDIATAISAMSLSSGSALFALVGGGFYHQMAVAGTTTGEPAFEAFPQVGTVRFVPTDSVTGAEIVLVDADQIAAGTGPITLGAARHATVQLDDAPDSPPAAAAPMVSLWQQGLAGLRAERWFGISRMRSTAVAVIS